MDRRHTFLELQPSLGSALLAKPREELRIFLARTQLRLPEGTESPRIAAPHDIEQELRDLGQHRRGVAGDEYLRPLLSAQPHRPD